MSVLREFNEKNKKNSLASTIIYNLTIRRLNNEDTLNMLLLELLTNKSLEELEKLDKSTSWMSNNFKETKFIVEVMWRGNEVTSWRKPMICYPSREYMENRPYLKYSSNEEWVKENLDKGFYISEVTEIEK